MLAVTQKSIAKLALSSGFRSAPVARPDSGGICLNESTNDAPSRILSTVCFPSSISRRRKGG